MLTSTTRKPPSIRARRSLSVAAIALILFTGMGLAPQRASAEIQWQRSPRETIASSRQSGKPILVFVTTDWCHYCKKMKNETWSDTNVSRLLPQQFETLLLDGDRDQRLVRKLGLKGYPATLLYTPDGHFVEKRNGFLSPAELTRWLSTAAR